MGAILAQNTNWQNVSRAINNLKSKKLLTPSRLKRLSKKRLAQLIRPAGYFNIKAERLKNFLAYIFKKYRGDLKKLSKIKVDILRRELLEIKGIGKETADSILLYALKKPIFVIDAYTKRILLRHKLIDSKLNYDEIQKFFMQNLKKEVKLFNEYHALLVRLGKELCLKRNPLCYKCPLRGIERRFYE